MGAERGQYGAGRNAVRPDVLAQLGTTGVDSNHGELPWRESVSAESRAWCSTDAGPQRAAGQHGVHSVHQLRRSAVAGDYEFDWNTAAAVRQPLAESGADAAAVPDGSG